MAFKMKGSPFQRNFGIGSPLTHKKTDGTPHDPPHWTDGKKHINDKSSYEGTKKYNKAQEKKNENENENENETKLGPPKGKIGSKTRQQEYIDRGWKFDKTTHPGPGWDDDEKTEKTEKGGHDRFHGLSQTRIDEIKAKETKRKERKSKYVPGTSDLKERTDLPNDQAFYDEKRNSSPRFATASNTKIQQVLDREAKREANRNK